jgi:hypothetical protein
MFPLPLAPLRRQEGSRLRSAGRGADQFCISYFSFFVKTVIKALIFYFFKLYFGFNYLSLPSLRDLINLKLKNNIFYLINLIYGFIIKILNLNFIINKTKNSILNLYKNLKNLILIIILIFNFFKLFNFILQLKILFINLICNLININIADILSELYKLNLLDKCIIFLCLFIILSSIFFIM